MSQFLPETPQSVQQTDFKPVVETPTLDGDIALMQRIFSAAVANPSQIPSDFLAYMVDFIQTQRLVIPVGQILGFTQQQSIRGNVASNGTIVSGTGFTCTHLGTGEYEIDFTNPLSSVPAINFALNDSSGIAKSGQVANATQSLFQVNTFTVSTGAKTDVGFYFTASPFV